MAKFWEYFNNDSEAKIVIRTIKFTENEESRILSDSRFLCTVIEN